MWNGIVKNNYIFTLAAPVNPNLSSDADYLVGLRIEKKVKCKIMFQ